MIRQKNSVKCRVKRLTSAVIFLFTLIIRYLYYYVPFPLFGPSLGIFYPGLMFTPNICSNRLTKITPQDEDDVLNSKVLDVLEEERPNIICIDA